MKLISCILFLFPALVSKAQMCPCEFGRGEAKPLRNEIGLNTFNINQELINFNSNKPVYTKNYVNGLMYKRHLDRVTLRAGFDYHQNNYHYQRGTTSSQDYNTNTGKSNSIDLRFGVEGAMAKGKLQPYMAPDLLLSFGQYTGTSEGNGDMVPYYKDQYKLRTAAFGIALSAGLRYRPFRNFSISAETSVSLLNYMTEKVSGNSYQESSTALLINPLRTLSMNYYF